jgi:SNF2 family DNA or RNA helicase
MPPLENDEQIFPTIEESILLMGEQLRPAPFAPPGDLYRYSDSFDFDAHQRRLERKEQKRAEEAARREANIRRLAEERRRQDEHAAAEQRAAEARAAAAAKKAAGHRVNPAAASPPAPRPPAPPPPVAISIHLPPLAFQDTALPLTDLRDFALRERAALWWVSNQSDDLLCLPHCRIQHLEYQVRTALRVLGPLRGRALLSDEVGLGKTIEAGLVLKELLTRGMVKRFLVLTLPSLVDQWAEELDDKFGLATVTTNEPASRDDPAKFWRESPGIVASLHTLKQSAHLANARQLQWDLLIVDEAHYLRNRDSQAWQAVNVLPRQFLLLLTATPVQNSLDELYNLVTLLMPGQLPTPRDFRARFFDPKRPRQPREPEELRRLLGQVMIRNTRANAGIALPPRRAETVLFTPDAAEAAFWREWETEFRAALGRLNASQSSLWGRLLLRAAGSSPAAWRSALQKFPDAATARAWRDRAPLEGSWHRKCGLIPPLARGSGGVVIFTEFLETQAALAGFLRGAGVATFVINGATPAPERQPITERFHQGGGALVLTHSGTEGRNLQFCHRLANFDLPWNPMEIEQRIGRLHRLGQQHPVEIHNFVQAGTLQEHLLQILQEKLNLFELVVGETGLVLGERYSGDEFEEEILRRWRASEGRVGEAFGALGDEHSAARDPSREVQQLDATLFAADYET